ncbi:MAG TPA: c-type cytochrome [Planctomycetota bacterium]|jgi:mono/diheme cytochrome c family protein|nr:c-type cytochrome [Planctomycetota bacterium]OQC20747.1 MAG: Cytochrome c [Planctomycetes bacterium ADurb.Bin069]NMD35062.1 c-type cytochrome [Planctomycetota bacterium]HNR98357.1 c-type cytochrome [Planctomycetota bacterium]HNU26752.1 c-type cytochrome [Planctomycetota bacterium]
MTPERHRPRACLAPAARAALMGALLLPLSAGAESAAPPLPGSGAELYRAACAACHGTDGRGAPAGMVGFDVPLPDFTDCDFASREAEDDWVVVAAEGGLARGFSEIMPAFGDALTDDQLRAIVGYLKSFGDCGSWPQGELNLPRPFFTTKAFPEDEAVLSTAVTTDGPDKIANKLVFERRIGAGSQLEVALPFGWNTTRKSGGRSEWTSALGDIALEGKQVLFHGMRTGSILSAGGEVILPTGDEDEGFGDNTTVFEPFLAFGQLLPADCFAQLQGGFKFPVKNHVVQNEAFWRGAIGHTFTTGTYGRSWSPMVEMLGSRNLEKSRDVRWDIVPQIQVSLSTRQHVRLAVGARLPLNHRDERVPAYMVYLLWDTFDGGLFEGW